MKNTTKLLGGVSAFALAAALSSGAWAHHVENNDNNSGVVGIENDSNKFVGDDGNVVGSSADHNALGNDIGTGSIDDNDIRNNDGSNIGQAISGVWLGAVVVNAVNSNK